MNSAKKAVKGQQKNTNQNKKQEVNERKPIFAGIIVAIVALVMCIGVGAEQLKPQNVLTVGDEKISMSDLKYRIWSQEQLGASMENMYQMYGMGSYWDAASQADATKTNRDTVKDDIIKAEKQMQVLYAEAMKADNKADYQLTKDEEKAIKEEVKTCLDKYSAMNRFRLGFSESYLTDQMTKQKIADKFLEAKKESFDIDEAEVTKDITKEDYREYDIEYYTASLKGQDETGKEIELSDEEIATLEDKMAELAKSAETAEDFTTLLAEDDKSGITQSSAQIIEKDGWTYLSEAQLKDVKAMENGEISKVIKDKENNCLFLIKMVDNNSTAAYESAYDSAIEAEKENLFSVFYAEVAQNYTMKVNDKVWDKVVIGTVTSNVETEPTAEPTKEPAKEDAKEEAKENTESTEKK